MFHWMERLLARSTELSVEDAYARWAPSYPPCAHNELMVIEERAVLGMFPDVTGRPALDLASGSGRYVRILLQRGASPVVGADISLPMLAQARETGAGLVRTDMRSLGIAANRFHVLVCSLAVGHVENLAAAVKEMSRVVAPGGTIIYSDFHPVGSRVGWKRAFRGTDGREYEVPHVVHAYSDHVAACGAARLNIEEVREPRIDFNHRWQGLPAVLVIRAAKAA